MKAELKDADDKYKSASERVNNLQQLQADIEQANIKVSVSFYDTNSTHVVVETAGIWHDKVIELIQEIG